jgi:putative peptidoglycan lipid II flippase
VKALAAHVRVAALQALGPATGLARETVFAAWFGAAAAMDALLLLFLPVDLLVSYARDLYTVLLPRIGGDARGAALLARAGRRMLTLSLAGAALLIVFASLCAWAGLTAGPAPRDVLLAAALAPAIPLLVLHGVNSTHLVRGGRFALVVLMPVSINAGAMLCVLAAGWAWGIISAGVGISLGLLALVVVECHLLWRSGCDPFAWAKPHHAPSARMRYPLAMLAGENICARAGVVIERTLGPALGAGAVSVLGYSTRLVSLPFNVLTPVVALPIFPRMVQAFGAGDSRRCARLLWRGIAASLALTVLTLGALLIWRHDIVRLAFQRGQFSAADTDLVCATLVFHSIGGVGWAVRSICERMLWAARRNAWSLAAGAFGIAVQLAAAGMLLSGGMGRNGLALSTAIAQTVVAAVMLAMCLMELRRMSPPAAAKPAAPVTTRS